jgi:hypothetical protein
VSTELYAITFKETGEVLNAKLFSQYWKTYGGSQLYGWRMPKKIYTTLGKAKSGFAHVPYDLKPHLEISIFTRSSAVMDGETLRDDQEERRAKKDQARKERLAKYRLKQAQEELNKAQAAF